MAQFPDEIYTPREIENVPGQEFDPDRKTRFYAEDKQNPDSEIVAVETMLGVEGKYMLVPFTGARNVPANWNYGELFYLFHGSTLSNDVGVIMARAGSILSLSGVFRLPAIGSPFDDFTFTIRSKINGSLALVASVLVSDIAANYIAIEHASPGTHEFSAGDYLSFSFIGDGSGTLNSAFGTLLSCFVRFHDPTP
jgi:hypothetical protein